MDLGVALLFPVWKSPIGDQALYQFPSAAMMKHHRVGGLNLKAYRLKTLRVESKTKVLAGLVTSGGSEGKPFHASLLASGGFLALFGVP